MEQARMFLAIVLSLAVIIIWQHFFIKKPEPQKPINNKPTSQQVTEEATKKPVTPEKSYLPESKPEPGAVSQTFFSSEDQSSPGRIITVENSFYALTISEHRAAFKSMVLKDYKETSEAE